MPLIGHPYKLPLAVYYNRVPIKKIIISAFSDQAEHIYIL